MGSLPPTDYVADATWAPIDYDRRCNALSFVQVSRDLHRRAVFLDPRYLAEAPRSPPVRLAALPLAQIRAARGPMHFVFHTAFCCSTLLARALDVPGVSMGLKEPSALIAFAGLAARRALDEQALAALSVTLDLMSRPMAPGETQIVKASNGANALMPLMLDLRPDAKALVLYSSVEAFLRAVARKGAPGRAHSREIFLSLASTMPLATGFTTQSVMLHTDLQIAAQAWLMQTAFMRAVADRYGPERVRFLNGDHLLADKGGVLTRVGGFFRLPLDRAGWERVARSPVFDEHAKRPGVAFDAAAHRAQDEMAAAKHGEEVGLVRDWTADLAARCGAPLDLGNTLFGAAA